MAENKQSNQEKKTSSKKKTLSLVQEALSLCVNIKLKKDQYDRGVAIIYEKEIRQVYLVNSNELKRYIKNYFYLKRQKTINSYALKEIIDILEARAFYEGESIITFRRVAKFDGKIYIDLCNSKKQCVEISKDGWFITNDPPVYFLQNVGMLSIPIPIKGEIKDIQKCFKIYDKYFYLILAWILGAFRGEVPYPVLIIQGIQGSGKSLLTEMIRRIIDPSFVPLRGAINVEHDFVVTANSSYMLAIDNSSGINRAMSDVFCRASTGGGFSKRKFFTDSEEVLLSIANPIIINGIDSIPDRPDLLERCLFLDLPEITTGYITKEEILRNFEENLPKALGGICTVLSNSLKAIPYLEATKLSRMADFVHFLLAAEKGNNLPDGILVSNIDHSQDELIRYSIENNSFISGLVIYIRLNKTFYGTAFDLLDKLNSSPCVDMKYRCCSDWPKHPVAVGIALTRFQPYLKRMGIKISRTRNNDKNGTRIISIMQED